MSGVNARDRVDDNALAVDARSDWTGAPIAYGLLAVAEAVLDLADAVREGNRPVAAPRAPAKPAPTDVCTCGHTRAEHHLSRGYPHAPCRVIGCACLDYKAAP